MVTLGDGGDTRGGGFAGGLGLWLRLVVRLVVGLVVGLLLRLGRWPSGLGAAWWRCHLVTGDLRWDRSQPGHTATGWPLADAAGWWAGEGLERFAKTRKVC